MSVITAITETSEGWQYTFTGNGNIHLVYEKGLLIDSCSSSPYTYATSLTYPPSIEIVSLEDETRLSMLEKVSAFCGTTLKVQWKTNNSPYYRVYIIDDDGDTLQKTLVPNNDGLVYTHEYSFSSTQNVYYSITACEITEDGFIYDKSDVPEITAICVYTPVKPVITASVSGGVVTVDD